VIRIANAPCSWGVLEFESKSAAPTYEQVLDEIAASGYAGTELGDWGFMPTEPARLRDELDRRRLALLGAFVTIRLADPASYDASFRTAVATAALLAGAAEESHPVIVLSDEPTADATRTRTAGRIAAGTGLTDAQWAPAARAIEHLATAVRDETGLRTVFHHHCATFVETPEEIDTLMARTDPALLGLCLDTGHLTYAGGSSIESLTRHRARAWHVHFKDCEPDVAERARREGWDYQTALRHGVFCELGKGRVEFPAVLDELNRSGYDGWIVVEQDVLPSMGSPLESATRNRDYLRAIGL
jgi:inosose dehydratase